MVKIDLITGFLGSGKTTFIKKYAKYLIDSGKNIGILENDYGAVNIDMMLLQDLLSVHQKTHQHQIYLTAPQSHGHSRTYPSQSTLS